MNLRKPNLQIIKSVKKTSLLDILNQLTSIKNDSPYETIAQYTKKNFHRYTRYGMLFKTDEHEKQFSFWIYRKSSRNDERQAPFKTKIIMTIDVNGNLIMEENLEILIPNLILLKQDASGKISVIDFFKTIQSSEIVPLCKEKNPLDFDNIVYFSLMREEKAISSYKIFESECCQVYKEFNPSHPLKIYSLKQHEPFSLDDFIKKYCHLIDKLKTGKVYFYIDAHCQAGARILQGEHSSKEEFWPMSIEQLVGVITLLIPKTAFLTIDVSGCESGKYLLTTNQPEKLSFCAQLNIFLKQKGFTNTEILGNVRLIYTNPLGILCQSPRLVATCGVMREPLTSTEEIQNSEVYHSILNYPVIKGSKSSRDRIILALKQSANKHITSHDSSYLKKFYIKLYNHVNKFEELEKLVTQVINNSQQWMKNIKARHPTFDEKFNTKLLLEKIEQIYQKALQTFNFSDAISSVRKLNIEHRNELRLYRRRYAEMYSSSSCFFDKYGKNSSSTLTTGGEDRRKYSNRRYGY